MFGARAGVALLVGLLAGAGVTGCEDLRQFSGPWTGDISRDPHQQMGFSREARLAATVGAVTRYGIDMTLQLPGAADTSRFEPIRNAVQDVLADMQLPGSPLRTYLGFVRSTGEEPFLAVVSLYAEKRVEVRLIRGPESAYGVFMLNRPGDDDAR